MKNQLFYLTVKLMTVVLFLLFSFQINAQTDLFTLEITEKLKMSDKQKVLYDDFNKLTTAKSFQLVKMKNFATFQQRGIVRIQLPNEKEIFTFKAKKVEAKSENNFRWYGELQVVKGFGGSLSVIAMDGRTSGIMRLPNGRQIEFYETTDGLHALMEKDMNKVKNPSGCGNIKDAYFPITPKKSSSDRTNTCSQGNVRVVVFYTFNGGTASNASGGVINAANIAINDLNAAFSNSQVNQSCTKY